MNLTGTRRTDRVSISILVEVSGEEAGGAAFTDITRTLVINRNGATIPLKRVLAPEQRIRIRLNQPPKQAEAKVVRTIGEQPEGTIYGIELESVESNFWGIDFPSESETAQAAGRTLLECQSCGQQLVAHLGALEAGVLEATGHLSRTCKFCQKTTTWKQPESSAPGDGKTAGRKTLSTSESLANADVVVPFPLDPLVAAPGEKGPAAADKRPFTKVRVTACIRRPGVKDLTVMTESVGDGGLSFKCKQLYTEGARLEVAVPYQPSTPAIFIPARIVRFGEREADGTAECFVAYIKTFVSVREADGSYSFVEKTTTAARRPTSSEEKKLDWKFVGVGVVLMVAGIVAIWRWQNAARPAPVAVASPMPATASEAVTPAAASQPQQIGGQLAVTAIPSGSEPAAPSSQGIAPSFDLTYRETQGRLRIAGKTEMPDGSALEVDVFSGDNLVALDAPVFVQGGHFETRAMLSRGIPFPPGKYQLQIQPAKPKIGRQPSAIVPTAPFQFSADFELPQ